MKRHALGTTRRQAAWILTFGLLATGCGRGWTTKGQPLPIPTLSSQVPVFTHNPNLPLIGTRPADTDVIAEFNDGTHQVLAKASGSDTKWSGALLLSAGQNTFKLFAQRSTGESPRSAPYSTQLVQLQTPTLANVLINGHVYFHMDGTSASVPGPLSGGKSADGDLELTYNGVTSIAATADNKVVWNANVTVTHADASCQLVSKDTAGDVSGTLSFQVTGTYQPGPHIDPASYTANTTHVQQTLYGTKPANTTLYLIVNGAPAVQVGSVAPTTWTTPSFNLSEGNNVIAVYVVGAQDSVPSAPDVARITLSTSVLPPVFSPPLPTQFPATANSTVTLTGSLGPNAYVCVSSQSWTDPNNPPPCDLNPNSTTPVGPNGGTFTVTVPLTTAADPNNPSHSGTNNLYITARDLAGNVSPEVTTSIYRVSPPVISGVSLSNNSVVSDANLTISFDASPYVSDASNPAAAITSVSVCVDNDCVNLPANPNGVYTRSVDPNLLVNAGNLSAHTVTITVNDAAGGQIVNPPIAFVYSTGAPLWLSADNGTPVHPANSAKAVMDAAGNLHVVWADTCAQLGTTACKVPLGANQIPPDIFYIKRSAAGVFGAIILITADAQDGVSTNPALAIDSAGNAHIVWEDNSGRCNVSSTLCLLHRTVSPSGVLSAIDVADVPSSTLDRFPALAADPTSGVVHLSYSHKDSPAASIMYTQLSGGSWSTPLQVNSSLNPNLASPDLSAIAALPGNQAQVVWQDCLKSDPNNAGHNNCDINAGPNHDIYTRKVLGPNSLDPNLILVTDALKAGGLDGDSLRPALFVDPSGASWIFWDDTGTAGIMPGSPMASGINVFYRTVLNDRLVENTYQLLSADSGEHNAQQASVSISRNGQVAVTWSARTGTEYDIYGLTANWTATLRGVPAALAPYPGLSAFPSVAVDPAGGRHVVWTDQGAPSPTIANPSANDLVFYNYYP